MSKPNVGLCNKCRARVPAEFFERDGQTWIRKVCPECGPNESLVSADAKVWQAKRDLWQYVPTDPVACTLNCDRCKVDHKPNMVFLDVTNRCNMNCPICIATIRGMGFDFNPPLAYFEKIFAELGRMVPQPVVQLFGGEPTVRSDLLEIIGIARKNGLRPHVVTNAVRLADEAYCKKLCDARVPLRLGFDGRNADIYEKMRHNRSAYAKKMKALENLKKFSRRKHSIIAAAAWGINDQYIGDLIQFVHDNRDLISDLGIIPLTENWEPGTFDAAKTTTMEDVEKMVQQAIPGGEVEFIPSGLAYSAKKPRSFFRKNPRSEVLLQAGVHPNCESFTLLISDGKQYRGINHYLKVPFSKATVNFAALSKKIEPALDKLDPKKFFQMWRGRLLCIRTFLPWALRTVDWVRLADGKPVRGFFKTLWQGIFRPQLAEGLASSRRPRRVLRLGMLPFEEQHSVDAARMESCKAVFAYEDPDDGKVKTIPACLWYPYRNAILEKLSKKYGIAGKTDMVAETEASATA
ncbi:MAG: radical SAM protein [Planctomycetota bacterium]|nr:radical SAM protein [Planctomycetota bacterium]